jgi:hypothetical protein
LNLARHGTHWDQHKEYPRTPYIPWTWNTVGFVKFSFLEKSRLKFISTRKVTHMIGSEHRALSRHAMLHSFLCCEDWRSNLFCFVV